MVDPSQLPVPEDEQFWNSPDGIRSLELGDTLNTNNVLWYFRLSQFFDHTSNNASLIAYGSQLPHNERLALFRSRTVFEDALRTRFPTGIQYVVVEEPKGPGMPWVIQRQNRKGQDVADVEATFYSSGTTFLKAPNLRDVLQARLVCLNISITLMGIYG
jgi:mediator of RNA polymerase II transcription subunit 6